MLETAPGWTLGLTSRQQPVPTLIWNLIRTMASSRHSGRGRATRVVSSILACDVLEQILPLANRHVALNQNWAVLVCLVAAVQLSLHSWTSTTSSACMAVLAFALQLKVKEGK